MEIIKDGSIKLKLENSEILTIKGKDVIELLTITTAFTNFIENNNIRKGDSLNV